MTDISLDAFMPLVLPYVRDCPELVARQALRSAIIEFCNESYWWIEAHPVLTIVAGQATYELDPPTDADVVAPMEVRINGWKLTAKSPDELDLMHPEDWRRDLTGTPRYYMRETPGELTLVPIPDATSAQALRMTVALRPSQDAVYVSDELYRRWAEEISYGARARLHEIPGQLYYDETASLKYRAKFMAAIGKARVERQSGMSRGPVRVAMPRII